MFVYGSVKRGVNETFHHLFSDLRQYGMLNNYKILPEYRFIELRLALDVGKDSYVLYPREEHRHLDAQAKIWPLIQKFNSSASKYCNFNLFRGLCLDESLRKSYGRTDATIRYNPSKPYKVGQQTQVLTGPCGLVISVMPDLDAKARLYKPIGELITKIIPKILVGKTKPAIVLLYSDRMGTVDRCDFCLNKWSISFKAQNRKKSWSHFAKRRLTNMLDIYILDLYLIVKNDMKKRGLKITNSSRHDF
jgi:hypothetical protein